MLSGSLAPVLDTKLWGGETGMRAREGPTARLRVPTTGRGRLPHVSSAQLPLKAEQTATFHR